MPPHGGGGGQAPTRAAGAPVNGAKPPRPPPAHAGSATHRGPCRPGGSPIGWCWWRRGGRPSFPLPHTSTDAPAAVLPVNRSALLDVGAPCAVVFLTVQSGWDGACTARDFEAKRSTEGVHVCRLVALGSRGGGLGPPLHHRVNCVTTASPLSFIRGCARCSVPQREARGGTLARGRVSHLHDGGTLHTRRVVTVLLIQPFSQNSRTATVPKVFQIGLYDPDSEHFPWPLGQGALKV